MIRDPFRLAILALLVETLAKITGYFPFLWNLRLAVFLFGFCLIYALMSPRRAIDFKLFRFRVPRLIVLQGILACFSAVFGISQGGAAYFILNNYWKTIAFALLLIASLRGVSDVRRMVKATALSGIILAFVSVFVIHVSKDNGTGTYDANDIGLIVVMTLPLALLIIQTSRGLWRLIAIAGVALIGVTIPMTASRGTFVGAVAVGTALLFLLPGISVVKRVVALGAIVATMIVVAPSSYWDSMRRTLFEPTSDYNWDAGQGRKELAKRGIGYMLRFPVFGIGVGNFGTAEVDQRYSEYAAEQAARHAGYRPSAPHNSWVQAGAETGIPGVLLWVALVVGSAWGVVRLRREMPVGWATSENINHRFIYLATLYVPIAVLGFTVCATFVSFAWADQSYVLPAIALGIQKAFAEQMALAGVQSKSVGPADERLGLKPVTVRPRYPSASGARRIPATRRAAAQVRPR